MLVASHKIKIGIVSLFYKLEKRTGEFNNLIHVTQLEGGLRFKSISKEISLSQNKTFVGTDIKDVSIK